MPSRLPAGNKKRRQDEDDNYIDDKGKEDGDYGYDEEPVTKSRAFAAIFIRPSGKYRVQEVSRSQVLPRMQRLRSCIPRMELLATQQQAPTAVSPLKRLVE